MTNSQNRPSGGSRYSSGGGQFSPPQHNHNHHHPKTPGSSGAAAVSSASPSSGAHSKGGVGGSSARKSRSQRSPSGVTYFASQSTLFFTPVKNRNTTNYGLSVTPTGQHQMSSSPPNLSHFAGSKCYEAPAPTALPRPPDHWKLPAGKGPQKTIGIPAKSCGGALNDGKSDIFSHNLKLLLNIKA